MALTRKLGISDSLLANVELAFAGADATPPAITTQGGSLGGQLGDTILALAEVDGPLTINLSAESVLALAQLADPAPVIVPHASPDWVLGGHDSQLGGLVPAFDGAPATLPTPTTQTGLLGTPLGAVVPGLDGAAGPMVFNLSAASVLSLLQTADPAPVIAPHASANWALGGQDSYLGGMTLAYAGLADARPFTTGLTGKLGTADSLLAGVRLALGLQEGEGTGGIVNADAASELSLSSEAAMAVARSAAASSAISLTSAAARNNLLSAAAESVVSLIVDAGRNNLLAATGESAIDLTSEAGYSVAWAIAAESQISLTDAAGRNNLLSAVAQSTISVSATAVEKVVRVLAAESVLSLAHEAANTGRTIYEVAAGSSLDLTSAASTAVAWAVAAADTLELTDQAGRNNLLAAVAESTISLTGAASGFDFAVQSAESTISLTSEAARNSFPAVIAESAISLTSQAWHQQIVEVSAESAISLTSESDRNSFPTAAAESAISLSDEAACTHIIGHRGEVWDWIELYDRAEVSVVRALVAESRIELVQTEHTARPWYVSAESPVQIATPEYDPEVDDIVLRLEGLQDVASVARPLTAEAHHSIPLHQTAGVVLVKPTAIDVSAESVLDLLGEVRINPTGRAVDWLALHHEAAVDRSKLVKSVLDLSQEAAVIVSVPRGAASALGLMQAATFSIVSRGSLQSYTPFVGEGPGPTPPPVTIGPPEHVALPFRLFYPAEGVVTDSVTLRAPNLGNKDRLSFNRILRETRGGTLIVFADPIWPKIQTLVLTFSGLRSIQVQQLLAFLETHLGEEIGLLDWEGRIWKGIVTTPEEPVVQDGKDSFSASLEFEGELVPA
jgi:hypothetical protein